MMAASTTGGVMRFGGYEVLEQVAVGSTGTVFRARDAVSGRVVAVKQLSVSLRSAPGVLEVLRAEAGVLRSLDDPHVVALLDAGLDDDPPWIAEQWVDGPTLDRVLQVHGALTPEQGVGVLRGAVQGLAHAHGRGVVHRDVAPGNVLLDAAGTSMLVDFGLAAPVGDGTACGTPAFVSPEAASGRPVGPAGDVYSAGAVLFLLLSGRPPFPAADVEQVLQAHRQTPAPVLEGPADGLRELVGRCLAKDPAARPPDGAALLAELDEQAERRFGAGWLGRASVAGVVAAVAGQATAGAGTAGAAAGARETVVLTTGAVSTGAAVGVPPVAVDGAVGPATGRPRVRWRSPAAVAVAVGVAVVALVAGAAATGVLGADDEPRPDSTATAAEAPSSLDGEWTGTSTVTQTEFGREAVGDTQPFTWTFDLDCPAAPCSGTVTSARGGVYAATWDGMQLTGTASTEEQSACQDDETGALTDLVGTVRYDYTLELTAEEPEPPIRGLTGILRTVVSAVETPEGCDVGPPLTSISEIAAERT